MGDEPVTKRSHRIPDDPFDYLALARKGLPQTSRPRRVLVVGAGAAGLVAAFELLRAGHDPLLVEATRRPGGRLYTLREAFDEGLYAEAGAMRVPEAHAVTLHYVRERFGLATHPFPNVGIGDRGFYHLDGKLYPGREVKDDPRFAANLVLRLWKESFRDVEKALEEGESWSALVERYKDVSLRDFLVRVCESRWISGDLMRFGQVGLGLGGYEALLGISFVELMRIFHCGWDRDQVDIEGGFDLLARKFLETPPPGCGSGLDRRIRFGAEAVRIEQRETQVKVQFRTAGGRDEVSGDYLILTAPCPVLTTGIEVEPPFSAAKRRAIQNLHYLASAKVFLQTSERFWEKRDGGGQVSAGTCITDSPLRAVYFPSRPFQGTNRGLVMASYTWEEDAQRWYSLDERSRIEVATRELERIFPGSARYCEGGASVAWHREPFARGAFALCTPGQLEYYRDLVRPEGRIYLAGEHASFAHGWVEGAVISGLRAAREICERERTG